MQQPVIGRSSHAVLESSWEGSGETNCFQEKKSGSQERDRLSYERVRRSQELRRSYQPARHSQEPGISSLEILHPGRVMTVLRQSHPYPSVKMFHTMGISGK
jgi:hypothetical protein